MRCSAAGSITGPTSLSTSLRTGEPLRLARPRPIRPPIEVPTQSTTFGVQPRQQRHHVGHVVGMV
jgi:hypothetical protein